MIVVGIDRSDAAAEALRFALHEAVLRGTRLRVVYAWSMAPMMEMTGPGMVPPYDPDQVRTSAGEALHSIVAAVAGDRAAEIEQVLGEGPAGDAILEHAQDAELIVVGSRGYGAVRGFLIGSVSQHVLHGAHCPVVVVPHHEA